MKELAAKLIGLAALFVLALVANWLVMLTIGGLWHNYGILEPIGYDDAWMATIALFVAGTFASSGAVAK